MSSYSNTNQNIIPKDCVYQCGVRIYWNTQENAYFEVFTKKKHVCPNRSANSNNSSSNNKSNYSYNKKPWFNKEPKPKMDNSLEVLQGSADTVKKHYEVLTDLIKEYGGKTHGSQSHILANNLISLVVYYEVPAEGNKREEVKQRFQNNNNFVYKTQQQNYR
jgi:hypothetical protein